MDNSKFLYLIVLETVRNSGEMAPRIRGCTQTLMGRDHNSESRPDSTRSRWTRREFIVANVLTIAAAKNCERRTPHFSGALWKVRTSVGYWDFML